MIPIYVVFNSENMLLASFIDLDELNEYLFENEGSDMAVVEGKIDLPKEPEQKF